MMENRSLLSADNARHFGKDTTAEIEGESTSWCTNSPISLSPDIPQFPGGKDKHCDENKVLNPSSRKELVEKVVAGSPETGMSTGQGQAPRASNGCKQGNTLQEPTVAGFLSGLIVGPSGKNRSGEDNGDDGDLRNESASRVSKPLSTINNGTSGAASPDPRSPVMSTSQESWTRHALNMLPLPRALSGKGNHGENQASNAVHPFNGATKIVPGLQNAGLQVVNVDSNDSDMMQHAKTTEDATKDSAQWVVHNGLHSSSPAHQRGGGNPELSVGDWGHGVDGSSHQLNTPFSSGSHSPPRSFSETQGGFSPSASTTTGRNFLSPSKYVSLESLAEEENPEMDGDCPTNSTQSHHGMTTPASSLHQADAFPSQLESSQHGGASESSSYNNLVDLANNFEGAASASTTSSGPSNADQASTHVAFEPHYSCTRFYEIISRRLLAKHYEPYSVATWIGYWALMHVTCNNYLLSPIRDAIVLQVGVEHMPTLTLASTLIAFCSSVPIGWLFEAPDPNRRRLLKRMGITRGETQGTSLALFYRFFAFSLITFGACFQLIEMLEQRYSSVHVPFVDTISQWWPDVQSLWSGLVKLLYVAFFLLVHMMKLHSISLVWGVTTEAMEYEDVARKRNNFTSNSTRIQRMALLSFGASTGGILGSCLASSMAQLIKLPGLLVVAAVLLELAAELSIELGRVMQIHWEQQQLFQSMRDFGAVDASMRRSVSMGSMKRVASGNSLNRVRSANDLQRGSNASLGTPFPSEEANDNTFFERLLRGVRTILHSRLLMAIFTYNALYASTTVLLSFQRAELVANRKVETTVQGDTAFLANINMASSVTVFALQASGFGALVASIFGTAGTLSLMPMFRLAGVLSLVWWHQVSRGTPPNLLIFLIVDECCKVVNLAVAKPVRESLWRGLSNEARYEAKPIVDTLANRWGGGSAAFLVSSLHTLMDVVGVAAATMESQAPETRTVFGLPPVLLLCLAAAVWWVGVSVDLGQIRRRIDAELKKRQALETDSKKQQ